VRSDSAPHNAEDERELRDSAEMFEAALAENPADLTVLEALREIYTRLGDIERLMETAERIQLVDPNQGAPGGRRRRGGTPTIATPPSTRTAPPPTVATPPSTRIAPPPTIAPPPAPVMPAARSAPPSIGQRAPSIASAPAAVPPPIAAPPFIPTSTPVRLATGMPAAGATFDSSHTGRSSAAAGRKRVSRARLGELLVAEGVISPEQLHDALREHRRSKERLGAVLARRGLVTEERLVELLSREHGLPSVDVRHQAITPDILSLVPAHIARKHEVLPISRVDGALTVAMSDPTNVVAMDEIAATTRLTVLPVIAAGAAIRAAIDRHYAKPIAAGSMDDVLAELNDATVEVVEEDARAQQGDVVELRDAADGAPVVKFVNKVLLDAIRRGASDLHWEPYEKNFRIRFRIDGVMHEMISPPKKVEPAVISRLKIMANLDISERRLPQDGRIKLRHGSREIDFRVSILPTIFGEKAVMRILDKESLQLDLTKLGFDAWAYEKFNDAIHQPYGMVLITGPTGSGKTTTLYSAISTINSPDHNIMTAEDPVEYNLKGVNQVQVNDGIGRTFAMVLRSFLRQDPDVILVGETRDLETAQISVRAALTGHLVFTTLHTNDCPSTVARLVDMGIPPFLLSSALLMMLAQRLGRRICKDCKQPVEGREEDLVRYGHVPQGRGPVTFYRGAGCASCNNTGMRGRVAIYEVMPISETLRDMILEEASTAELREQAQKEGMKTLRQAGLAKVVEGVTTLEEVLRVTLA
jgi:type IV pilus assembly protein PilB